MHDDDLGPDELVGPEYWGDRTDEGGQAAVIFDPAHYMRVLGDDAAAELFPEIRENWGSSPEAAVGDAELFQMILSHDYWRPVTAQEQAVIVALYDER